MEVFFWALSLGPESTWEHPYTYTSNIHQIYIYGIIWNPWSWESSDFYNQAKILLGLLRRLDLVFCHESQQRRNSASAYFALCWEHVAPLCYPQSCNYLELPVLVLQPKASSSRGWCQRLCEAIPYELSLHGIFLFLPCKMSSFGTLQRIFSTAKMTEFTGVAFVTAVILEWKETAGHAATQFVHFLDCKSWNRNCLWDWYTKYFITIFPFTRCSHCRHRSYCSHYLTHTGFGPVLAKVRDGCGENCCSQPTLFFSILCTKMTE